MLKPFLLTFAFILLHRGQDVHVATWSTGSPDSDTYESLSFWVKDNRRAHISYEHGKDAESIDLIWLGADTVSGMRGFRISAPTPGADPLVIVPQGASLHVFDRKTRHDRSFHWENENDTTADAAPCTICAKSEKQATEWVRRYFM